MTQRIRKLYEERIGLDAESLGGRAFDAAVSEAGKTFANLDVYADTLTTDRREFDALVERLIVPETWFYRGGMLFEFLANHISEWGQHKRSRILCIPCSTGEEPYSLAIALTEAGVLPSQWEIYAVDLSPASITLAKRGVYREFSFRELPAALKAKYFREVDGSWQVAKSIRDSVRFEQGNLLDARTGSYDVILCRNLLIYLTQSARTKAIDNLLTLLTPEGLIGVGHAEPSALTERGLAPVGTGELFLFSRSLTMPKTPEREASVCVSPIPHVSPPRRVDTPRSVKTAPAAVPDVEPRSLASVQRLADSGHLNQALAECRELITDQPHAESYALLGLIHLARGEAKDAKETFRKALYLDPKNPTALAMARISGGAA